MASSAGEFAVTDSILTEPGMETPWLAIKIENTIRKYKGIQNGIYVYQGVLTNKYLAETFKLPYKDLQLLISNLL